jgi:regulator of sigma E protease
MNILIAIVAFVITIGVLVTFHEFGHFWVSRRLGVPVQRFSIGFGRPLWSHRSKKDGVEYVIAPWPIGGYNKHYEESDVPESERPRVFTRQPLWVRTAIVLAGPVFNFIFAVVAYWIIFMLGVPGIKPIVGPAAHGTPAAVAGIKARDQLLSVGGTQTPTWQVAQLQLLEGVMAGGPVQIKVRDPNGGRRNLKLQLPDNHKALTKPGALLKGLGLQQWQPRFPAVLAGVTASGTAKAAGLGPGDRIVAAAGKKVKDWEQFQKIVRARPGQSIPVVFYQGALRFKLELPIGSKETANGRIGFIGAKVKIPKSFKQMRAEQQYNPWHALSHAAVRTGEMSFLTIEALWKTVIGQMSWRSSFSGPIGIAQYAGSTASAGAVPFLSFLAIVSISLGILNLLPVPVLDGGHLLYYLAEFVKGSPVSMRTQLVGQQIGITLLLTLMGFAVYNDLARIFS